MTDILIGTTAQAASKPEEDLPQVWINVDSSGTLTPLTGTFVQINRRASTRILPVDENLLNSNRLANLQRRFTSHLIDLILETDFEYGFESQVDVFLRNHMLQNRLATKSWLNHIFVTYYGRPAILVGILRSIARLPFFEIVPEGQVMATAAISHKNVEVRECGIRAFENWGNLTSLEILGNVQVHPPWLQDYVDRIVNGLAEELHATHPKKDK